MHVRNQYGQAMVEFAMILPLFILLLMGFVYSAMVFHDYLTIGDLTRSVARYESVGKKYNDIRDQLDINPQMSNFYTVNMLDGVKVQSVENSVELGNYITVTVTAKRHDESSNFVKYILPAELTTSLSMRKEE